MRLCAPRAPRFAFEMSALGAKCCPSCSWKGKSLNQHYYNLLQLALLVTAGEHVLKVVARGETDPEVVKLNLPSNSTAHEVHVRGFLVVARSSAPGSQSQ